ncbi:SDR family NAD(P)-dependent oxidoreductase [Allorhizocola rhizosphaerae]|uniref:SDR family NAD(P)-dependent oxidoreductase n=1 Tax=Allorhizocola rhizosphaerae TaxID=1872709 RepID=UPI000E3D43E3|nr:3-oxoacyl-ACP reductase family protein [Allorhizocola rhizosphaerae]
MKQLAGKAALVTGGSRGIGAAIAKRLAQEGADVAITYLQSVEKANDVVMQIKAAGGKGMAIAADNADMTAVARAVDQCAQEFGRLDILVNNAGIFPFGPVEQVTLDELERTLAVHTKATFVATQAAVQHMADGGRVINIGSSLAERVPYAGVALYSMSKSALIGFTKGLARDLGPRGITANVVHPGSTDTDMNPANGEAAADELPFIALGRYAMPEDVAAMVAHLAGPGGRNITGTSIAVDGGVTA